MSCKRILSGETAGICALGEALAGRNLIYCSYEFNGQRILGNCIAHFELPKGTTIVRPFDSLRAEPSVGIRANQMRVTKIVPTNSLHKRAKVIDAYDPPAEWYPEWGATNPFNYIKDNVTTVNIDLNLSCLSQPNGLNFSKSKKSAHLTKYSD